MDNRSCDKVNELPELGSFLEKHKLEIITDWVNRIEQIEDSHYQKYTRDELTNWISQELEGMIHTFNSGSCHVLEDYLTQVVISRLEEGFTIYEVTESLLLSKEAIFPVLLQTLPNNSPLILPAITQLNVCIRCMIRYFGSLFSEANHQQLVDEINKRLVESESIKRTMSALLQKLKLDEVLEVVCSEAKQLTNATGSAVLLVEQEWLQVTFSIGNPLPVLQRIPVENSIAGEVIQKGQSYLINSPKNQIQAYHREPDLTSLLVVPLFLRDESIGVIDVVNKPSGFTDDDIRILNLFADQAAIAIETSRLHQKAEQLAILNERHRLARDLHDSVTQTIYSLSLFTNATQKALVGNRVGKALINIREAQKLIREAMLDMRLLIFELHPPILQKEGLAAALRTRLESVEARSGIHTQYDVSNERRLDLKIETEVYHIAQEALTNVVKHSGADAVSVSLDYFPEKFLLSVEDNGIGFNAESVNQGGGLGLKGIRERVRKMNGTLNIESSLNTGTKIEVILKI